MDEKYMQAIKSLSCELYMILKEVPEEMKKEALAHALLGSYLYKNRLYKGSEEK